jgi:hypothetical protein
MVLSIEANGQKKNPERSLTISSWAGLSCWFSGLGDIGYSQRDTCPITNRNILTGPKEGTGA